MEQTPATSATWEHVWRYATNPHTRTVNHRIIAWALGVPEAEVTRLVNDHAEQWQGHPMCNEGFGKVCYMHDDVRLVGWTPGDQRRRGDRWIPGDKVPGVNVGGERNGRKNGNGKNGNGRHLRAVD